MTSTLVQQLSYIVPATSIGFLFVITSMNVYFKIRKHFPATVNCHFCNVNTNVPYAESNSWTCPSCGQYNGFTADGDYNCDIPSQRNSRLNKVSNANADIKSFYGSIDGTAQSPFIPPSNGLCQPCNRNQELKMQQLASFEPENETYFDEEVEDFQHKLEQAYRLCPQCERYLKRKLNNVKKNILGSKLAQLGAKGLCAFESHYSTGKMVEQIQQRRQLFTRMCLFSLIVISTIIAYQTTAAMDINKNKLDAVFNTSITAVILIVASYCSACNILIKKFINYFISLPYITAVPALWQMVIAYLYSGFGQTAWNNVLTELSQLSNDINATGKDEIVIANVAGCLLSIFAIFATGFNFKSAFALILWSVNSLLATQINRGVTPLLAVIIDSISFFVVWALAIISTWNFIRLPVSNHIDKTECKNNSFHRINSDCELDETDESGAETEPNTSNQSNHSIRTTRSGKHLFQSNNCTPKATFVSYTPTTFSESIYAAKKPYRRSLNNLLHTNRFDSDSIRSFDRSRHFDFTRDVYDGNQSVYSSMVGSTFNHFDSRPQSVASYSGSMNQLCTRDAMSFSGHRSPSRCSLNDIPDKFENDIIGSEFNINAVAKNCDNYHNNRVNETNDSIAAFSIGQRNPIYQKPLLLPARLSYNEKHQQEPSVAANQSSWVAGGYWNNTSSPRKRHENASTRCIKTNYMFPIISRTSSQSSGIESMKNCNGITPPPQRLYEDKNDVDGISMFSDRASNTRSRIESQFMTNTQKSHVENVYPHKAENCLRKSQLRYPVLDKNQFTYSTNLIPKSVCKTNSFNTATLQQNLPYAYIYNGNGGRFTKNVNNLEKFNSNVDVYQKGNLLKIKETNRSETMSGGGTDNDDLENDGFAD